MRRGGRLVSRSKLSLLKVAHQIRLLLAGAIGRLSESIDYVFSLLCGVIRTYSSATAGMLQVAPHEKRRIALMLMQKLCAGMRANRCTRKTAHVVHK